MRHSKQGRQTARASVALGAFALLCLPHSARAAEQSYDAENRYGTVHIDGRDVGNLQPFDRSRSLGVVSVSGRGRPAFEQHGIRVGNYIIFPEVKYGVTYDDNTLGIQKPPTRDWRHELSSVIKFQSFLPRHLLDFSVGGRAVAYQKYDERSYYDGFISGQGRIDINYGHAFVGNFLAKVDHEERRSGETPLNAKRPVEYTQAEADVGFVRSVGRLSALAGAKVERKNFFDVDAFGGGRIDQGFRDTDTYTGYLKTQYLISPGYKLTGRLEGIKEENVGTATFNRSNTGYEAALGLDFELTRLVRAGVEVGYTTRDFHSDALSDISAALYEARLAWMVTPLVTMNIKARRVISATSFGTASGRIDNIINATAEYEMLSNLVLNFGVDYGVGDFVGTTRQDVLWQARAGAEYALTKHVILGLQYEFERLTSNVNDYSFQGNKVMATVKVRY